MGQLADPRSRLQRYNCSDSTRTAAILPTVGRGRPDARTAAVRAPARWQPRTGSEVPCRLRGTDHRRPLSYACELCPLSVVDM